MWWWRQRVNDLGLGTWFQPSVDVQRNGVTAEQIGDDPVIQRGDVLHCDVGITVARLNTDTQHLAYVLRRARPTRPKGCAARSPTPTRCRTSSWRRSARTDRQRDPAARRARG